MSRELPIPPHFKPDKIGEVWRVDYQEIAERASTWAKEHAIEPAANDRFKICLIAVDVQNTFCIPGFELYVGGRSGTGAVDDNRRLSQFIYRNLDRITQIVPTMDTHQAMQIFHSIFLIDKDGKHPPPFSLITQEDIAIGRWRFNDTLTYNLERGSEYIEKYLLHYTRELKRTGKYELTMWPYHAMLGGIGHALVSGVEEAIFFHTIARSAQPDVHIKGNHPLTEHYSVLGPEVSRDQNSDFLVRKSDKFLRKLIEFDAVLIAGQAKSHCVAWTISDLLEDITAHPSHRHLVDKVYLLEDCTSPVVIPGVIDYAGHADKAFARFESAGMHVITSSEALENLFSDNR